MTTRGDPGSSSPETGREHLCPSGRCAEGSVLLGIVSPDGRVAYLRPRTEVDGGFVAAASAGRDPGKRFRFAEPCAQGGCGHWGGTAGEAGRCTLVDRLVDGDAAPAAALPACSIRADCTWFAQRGPAACRVCPYVVRSPDPVKI